MSTHLARFYEASRGEVLLSAADTGEGCGFDIQVGQGRAIVITAAYPCDVSLFRTILEQLGARAALDHHCEYNGIFMTTSTTTTGERLLHVLNLDGFDKEIHITEHGQPLFEGRTLLLRRREGLMLPLNLSIGSSETRIAYSTAEIAGRTGGTIEFRLTQPQDTIVIVSPQAVVPGQDYDVERRGDLQFVTSRKPAVLDDRLILRLEA